MRDLRSSGKYIPIRPSLFNRSIGQEVCDTEYPSWLVAIVVVAVDEDEDGIIPLVPNSGEKILLDRVEEKFLDKGFSMAQYSAFDGVLGRNIKEYINGHFFKALSDHLNLFMQCLEAVVAQLHKWLVIEPM